MPVTKIRRPGRYMLDMAIKELIGRDQCWMYDRCLGEVCSVHPDCHECWTNHLMWEVVQHTPLGELAEK